jgi:hypothetical protein
MAQINEFGCDLLVIPLKMRPVWVFVDPGIHGCGCFIRSTLFGHAGFGQALIHFQERFIHRLLCSDYRDYSPQRQDIHRILCGIYKTIEIKTLCAESCSVCERLKYMPKTEACANESRIGARAYLAH